MLGLLLSRIWACSGLLLVWSQNVGIGTNSPIWNLTVRSSTQRTVANPFTTGIGIASPMVEGDGQQAIIAMHWVNLALPYSYRLWMADPDGGFGVIPNSLELWEYPPTGNCCRPRLRIQPTRNINFTRLPVIINDDNAVMAYGFNTISDSSQKQGWVPLPYGLEKINQLRPVVYWWNDEPTSAMPHVGFLAQEVRRVLPEATASVSEEIVGVDMAALVAVLTRSLQQLAERVGALETWVNQQKHNLPKK
ncbi:MAG: tail fiber domain-containing protein [Bacteroidia bacterium]|nr:tail fiber domain-containing protein [Bacteroidia bacterium]MDW8235650.1 tail fiber domain-containing protein [Bacteroidia bacterium]